MKQQELMNEELQRNSLEIRLVNFLMFLVAIGCLVVTTLAILK